MSARTHGGRRAWARVFQRTKAAEIDVLVQRRLAELIDDEPLPDADVSQTLVENALAGDGRRVARNAVLRSLPLRTVAEHDEEDAPSKRWLGRPMVGIAMGFVVAAGLAIVVVRRPPREEPSPVAVHVSSARTIPAIASDSSPPFVPEPNIGAARSCVALEPGKRLCWASKDAFHGAGATANDAFAAEGGEDASMARGGHASALSFEFAGYVVFTEIVPDVTVSTRSVAPSSRSVDSPERRTKPRAVAPQELRTKPRSPGTFFSLAREALMRGQPREAASLYEELLRVHPRSAEARAATVALAEIDLHQLGRPKAAERLFREYLKGTSSRGDDALALEARAGRVQALARLGRTREEAAAIRDYLRHHADSGNAEALRQRLRQLEGPANVAP